MKQTIFGFLLIATAAFPQQLSYEVRVVNIEVPVRVFDGDKFVDHLRLDDFEVLEDGIPQKIDAVYLFKKTALKRKEEKTAFKPDAARRFYMFFSIFEYDPKIPMALTYFFKNVIKPGDQLMVITPRAAYDMNKTLAENAAPDKIADRLTTILKKDIQAADSAYRSVLADLKRMAGVGGIQSINPEAAFKEEYGSYGSGSPQEYWMKYKTDLQALESLRTIDEAKLVKFGESIKNISGQKIVFFFYQKEFVPVPPGQKNYADDPASPIAELFDLIHRKSWIDADRIKKVYSDSSINFNFLFISKRPNDVPLNNFTEGSDDIFPAFTDIAQATGGLRSSSANPDYLMQQASQAAENYYLLFYSPKDKTADGKFRTVTVRVKSGNYRIAHLAGYFATDVPIRPPALAAANPEMAKPESAKPALQPETKPAAPKDEARAAEVVSLLEKSAAYCRRLEKAALNFVCYEQVVEKKFATASALAQYDNSPVSSTNGSMDWPRTGIKSLEWIYDFQLIRNEGLTQEKRTLVREDGLERREENAELKTSRFSHRNVFLGPIGLMGDRAQMNHTYRFVKEGQVDGDPVLVIEAAPRGKAGARLFGKAWVRERDGAVLRIEWEPASMENYAAIEEFSRRIGKAAKIAFVSEYGFEKNGLRFPNFYDVTESYVGLRTTWGFVYSQTTVIYKNYKFFQVETTVDIR